MAFSRKSTLAAVAGTLSLAMLTGCPAPNPVTPPTGSPSPAAPASPAPTATAAPDGETPAPTETPAAQPSPSKLATTTVRGKVYDEKGAVVNNANVTIKSLGGTAFETTVTVANGAYVANDVPSGETLEITAKKDGWTSRTRVETLLPLGSDTQTGNRVDFGGAEDTAGQAYFISDYPEIMNVEPNDEATNVPADKVEVKLTLSEALDETNQRRLARALRLGAWQTVPAENAIATNAFTANITRVVEEGATFLDTDNVATVTWNAEGTVATLSFNAPLLQDDDQENRYVVGLVRGANAIQDKSAKALGTTGAAGSVGSGGNANELLHNVFKDDTLALSTTGNAASAQTRWDETHLTLSRFQVAEDDTSPELTGVSVTGANRISLTFSEPMVAYNGDGVATSQGVLNLNNYSFRVADSASDIEGETWTEAEASGSTNTTFAGATETDGAFKFTGGATIEVSTSDPKVVRILATNTTDKFPTDIRAIKVRVDSRVKDPAGNSVKTTGDANFKVGTF